MNRSSSTKREPFLETNLIDGAFSVRLLYFARARVDVHAFLCNDSCAMRSREQDQRTALLLRMFSAMLPVEGRERAEDQFNLALHAAGKKYQPGQ